jgi:hypothetical protein
MARQLAEIAEENLPAKEALRGAFLAGGLSAMQWLGFDWHRDLEEEGRWRVSGADRPNVDILSRFIRSTLYVVERAVHPLPDQVSVADWSEDLVFVLMRIAGDVADLEECYWRQVEEVKTLKAAEGAA